MKCNPQLRCFILWTVIAISGVAGGVLAEEPDEAGWLSPPDLYRIAEESDNTYTIYSADDLADVRVEEYAEQLWPSIGGVLSIPWIEKGEDGNLSLMEYELAEGCLSILVEAEPLFDAKRYGEARALYLKATRKYPQCYVAISHVADCHYFTGEYKKALKWYEKAIKLNPFEFLGHYYKGNTLFRLDRFDEARESYVMSLALRPHRESVVEVLQMRVDELSIGMVDKPFMPRAFARQEENGIGVYVDSDKPFWLTYGLCKAVWIGEPELRAERTGKSEHPWSLREERQCIMSVVESYYALREEESIETDPEMERLLHVLESDLLDGFVLYEIAYRLTPHMTLLLSEEMFVDVVKYINLHVATDRANALGAQPSRER
jgi:tetratricopeptide (TPR) repeat protein